MKINEGNMMKRIAIFALTISLSLGCADSQIVRWNLPGEMQIRDAVIIRRFNSAIIEFDGREVSAPRLLDIAVPPGERRLVVQQEMWVSSFPTGKHFKERKELVFKAEAGQCVYLCLGLMRDLSWSPFVVIVRQEENPRQALLSAMETRGGCFSYNKTIPVFWLK